MISIDNILAGVISSQAILQSLAVVVCAVTHSEKIKPLVEEIEYQDPVHLYEKFLDQPWSFFLDSAQPSETLGRYSYITANPFKTMTAKDNVICIDDRHVQGNPFDILQELLSQFPLTKHRGLPPFQGGVLGYFSYELYQHLEQIPLHRVEDVTVNDCALGFYDVVIAFDHLEKRAWILSSGFPKTSEKERLERARQRISEVLTALKKPESKGMSRAYCQPEHIQSNFSKETYQSSVQKVIDYIYAGDIFEANISQRFKAPLPQELTPFDLYRRLRLKNPAPFSAYLNLNDSVIASASPERFLRLEEGVVEARPIKGTRPRGRTAKEDLVMANELQESEKDRAENMMIVDLMRNDLSRVCQDHSVHVEKFCGLESFATVHHLVSVVTGMLRECCTAIDLLKATFPGGSITGAPKVRAMEIIAEIEPHRRGPYCGSIGYIGFDGSMDLSITIRTFVIKNQIVTFHAGGAVVADSDPAMEHEETMHKAWALHRALLEAA